MKPAFYSGASGLMATQRMMDNIGNNIANVNTMGFKPQVVTFDSLIRNEMYVNADTDPTHGTGTRARETGIDSGSGNFVSTGELLNFAVVGDGWFAVSSTDGDTQYTRDGNFCIMLEDGDDAYLGTIDGGYVLDEDGDPIELPTAENGVSLDLSEVLDSIGVYVFPNANALAPIMNNRYVATDLSGEAEAIENGGRSLLQGALEGANVDITDLMSDLIIAQRSYQLSARVVQTSDENEQTVNSLRR